MPFAPIKHLDATPQPWHSLSHILKLTQVTKVCFALLSVRLHAWYNHDTAFPVFTQTQEESKPLSSPLCLTVHCLPKKVCTNLLRT